MCFNEAESGSDLCSECAKIGCSKALAFSFFILIFPLFACKADQVVAQQDKASKSAEQIKFELFKKCLDKFIPSCSRDFPAGTDFLRVCQSNGYWYCKSRDYSQKLEAKE
jgi:hypothetical protein